VRGEGRADEPRTREQRDARRAAMRS